MTSKTVLLKAPVDRNFKVSFLTKENQSDLEAFKESFFKICEKTDDLKVIMSHDRLLFRRYDDKFKCDVELTDYEDIPDGTIIELYVPVKTVFLDQSEISDVSLQSTDKEDVDLFISSQNSDELTDYLSISSETQVKSKSPRSIQSRKRVRECGLVYPCSLPKFSPIVKNDISNGTIFAHYSRFVRECAAFLLTLVEKPSSADYDVFCLTLSKKYDFINIKNIPGTTPYIFFKRALSQTIRNGRYYQNKKMKTANAASSTEIVIDVDVVDNVQNEDKMHNDEIRKSLKKKEIDIRHITYLMKTTAFSRRQQILTSSLKIIEVQDLYPALKFQEWIIFDFSYESDTVMDERKQSFDVALYSLKQMFSTERSSNEEITDLDLFKWVEKKTASKRNVESCIKVHKVGDTIKTTCHEIQAPYVIVYETEAGEVAAATILGEGAVICQLKKLSLFEILDSYLAVYYTFDYDYPKAYIGFLTFLQTILVKKVAKGQKMSAAFVNFMKEYGKFQ